MSDHRLTLEAPLPSRISSQLGWYELFSRGARDWLRHNEKVREAVKDHLPMILLGNEIDQTGNFPSTNATTTQTYIGWVEQSFDNLKTSLANADPAAVTAILTFQR